MPIRITLGDKSWLTEDLTLDECARIEAEIGESWMVVITAPTKTAETSRAIIKRFLAREHGEEEGAKRAGALTLREVAGAFEVVPDDLPEQFEDGVPVVDPKAAAAGSETTSSS